MAQGVFGIVGVVLGVVLGYVATAWEQSRRSSIEARRAIRLVDAEFALVERGIEFLALTPEILPQRPDGASLLPSCRDEAWREYRATLAGLDMADRDWATIVEAVEIIELLSEIGREEAAGDRWQDGLVTKAVESANERVPAARRVLAKLRGSSGPDLGALMAGRGGL